MRIIAGKHRGRRLHSLPGRDVRPTAARVREALFNILAHGGHRSEAGPLPRGTQVVDVFAGTGALGFEALSRGARHVVFIDDTADALALIRRTAEELGETAAVTLVRRDARNPGRPDAGPCALALLDPPYRSDLAAPALAALAANGWLDPGAWAVVELAAKEPFEPPSEFAPADERRYGAARLVFLRLQ